jgi:hypothetical protein
MSSYPLFHSLSLSLSLSLSHTSFMFSSPTLSPLASPSPSTLHLPWVFPPFAFSSPMGFSLTSSPPQLIALSISYLNSPLPTTPTIGDVVLEIFLLPMLLWWFVYERCNFFPLFLFSYLIDLWILWYVLLLGLQFLFLFFYWIYGF